VRGKIIMKPVGFQEMKSRGGVGDSFGKIIISGTFLI
jgi:hypothetical protein